MSLNINGKELGQKEFVVLIICLILVMAGVALTVVAYSHKKEAAAIEYNERTEVEQTKMSNAKLAEEKRIAEHQADVSRLVSVCIMSQERFDKLPVKQQALEARPDCTIE